MKIASSPPVELDRKSLSKSTIVSESFRRKVCVKIWEFGYNFLKRKHFSKLELLPAMSYLPVEFFRIYLEAKTEHRQKQNLSSIHDFCL